MAWRNRFSRWLYLLKRYTKCQLGWHFPQLAIPKGGGAARIECWYCERWKPNNGGTKWLKN